MNSSIGHKRVLSFLGSAALALTWACSETPSGEDSQAAPEADTAALKLAPVDGGADSATNAELGSETSAADPTAVDVAADTTTDLDVTPAIDAAADATSVTDAGTASDSADDASPTCAKTPQYSYTCDAKKPGTCPGGACLFGLCIGPKLDPTRWDHCGDGVCEPCEPNCPVDCGPTPVLTGSKQYTGAKTLTVWLHGFSNQGADKLAKLTYGEVKGCGDVLQTMQNFGVQRPCGDLPATQNDPNQLISVEYYGSVPAPWLTKQDIAEVDQYPFSGGPTGLQRYARIVAKFTKWRMATAGATHVQFACHSMGCLIVRQLIENDEEKLASTQKIVRWSTATGVVAGAKLSRLFNNPAVQQGAVQLGLELSDFILMNPDYVWDITVAWDHKLHEANNPLLQGILIHHVGATKPQIAQAFNIALLDVLGGGNEPNDGIMYTEDMHFWQQDPKIAAKSTAGDPVPPSLTLVNVDHMTCPSTEAAGLLATAALFHSRKVQVRLTSFQLLDDHEKANLLDSSEHGLPPAEVVVEAAVRYNPFVLTTFNKDVLVHDDRMATRTAPLWSQAQGETKVLNQLVFQAPVLDGMKELAMALTLVESDYYPKFKVTEWAFDSSDELVAFVGSVPLQDGHTFEAKSKYGVAKFLVRVHQMY
ncbi:MAG: hypothetical protein EXR77_09035 [Myxococcales bacterium]|nr:hypothetical protein [Myxococcales bacterium]